MPGLMDGWIKAQSFLQPTRDCQFDSTCDGSILQPLQLSVLSCCCIGRICGMDIRLETSSKLNLCSHPWGSSNQKDSKEEIVLARLCIDCRHLLSCFLFTYKIKSTS